MAIGWRRKSGRKSARGKVLQLRPGHAKANQSHALGSQ